MAVSCTIVTRIKAPVLPIYSRASAPLSRLITMASPSR